MSQLKLSGDASGTGIVTVAAPNTNSTYTVTLPASATTLGGGVTWQSVQTTGFTAVAGRAYPCNTTSAAFTVTLPASPTAGDLITLTDYAGTFATNVLTIDPNGNKLNGGTSNLGLMTARSSAQLVYVDATQGWIAYSGLSATPLSALTLSVDFLVIAGGAGGTPDYGGGGAGGYRTSAGTSGGGASAESALTLNLATAYTLTVGAGGNGANGSNSVFATVTSTGGGKAGSTGGSGGGSSNWNNSGSAGTANQGYAGGNGSNAGPVFGGGGGGGAGAVGANGTTTAGGNGGAGVASSITGSSVTRAGGGGGGSYQGTVQSSGGSGGGGAGAAWGSSPTYNGGNGSANTGSGGGAGGGVTAGLGGSGVVIIKIADTRTATFSGGVTSSLSTSVSGYKIYTITATSTTSETVTFS